MGTIQVKTNDGVLSFKIKGDTPTPLEQMRMQRVITEQSSKSRRSVERKKERQMFDYKTGIQDKKLRRRLSRADTKEDEILALKSMGLTEEDFTRDRRGRIALTPKGAAKFDVQSDKNVVIDERGLTMADFSDLSSLSREIAGGVGGALVGQAAIPIPILGAAAGAFLGTGGAKLLEEGQEYLEGTQSQTGTEVLKDTALDATIGAASEFGGQVLFKGIGKLFGKTGGDLTDDQIKLAGKSIEKFGIKPTLGQIGANKLLSRQQSMGENIIGTSGRLRENHKAIVKQLEKMRSDYGTSDPSAIADILVNAAKSGAKSVEKEQSKLTTAIINNFKEANEALGAAAKKDVDIDGDLYKILRSSYKQFDDDMIVKFSSINKLMNDSVGDIKAFNVKGIKADAKTKKDQFAGVSRGNQAEAERMLDDIINLPDDASFSQIYRARKNLNDAWLGDISAGGGSSNINEVKDQFLQRLDDHLEIKEISKALNRKTLRDASLSSEQKELFRSAARQITPARAAFKEGRKQFEKLSGTLGIRTLVKDIKGGVKPNISGAANTLIKPDNPQLLKNAAVAVGGDSVFNPIKARMAGEWMRKAFKTSMKDNNPTTFSVKKFHDKLDELGTTGSQLFGKDLPEIKKLANQMSALNLTKVSDSMIDEVASRGADESGINLLRNLKTTMDEKSVMDKSRAFKALQDGSITSESAAAVIAQRATKDTEVAKLINYFDEARPEDLTKIKSFYIDNIIGDFGDSFLSDPKQFKLFGKRLQDEFNTGKLSIVFGKDMANDMKDFGDVMVFNSGAVEAGNLVAANIAAQPLENLGKILKFSTLGLLFKSAPQYKSIVNKYKRLTNNKSKETKAEIFGNLLADAFSSLSSQTPAQLIQEGVQETKNQVSSFLESEKRRSTPVPKVLPPISQIPSQIPAPISKQTSNVRQRARENPGAAATLLGGLGSAELL